MRRYSIQKLINFNLVFFIIAQVLGNFFVNLSLISFSLLFLNVFFNKKSLFIEKLKKPIILVLSIFFILIITISFFLNNEIKDLNLIRFYFFCLSFYVFSEEIIKSLRKYYQLFYFFIFFIALDGIIQFIFGKNIIGIELYQGTVTGFFGDEQIIGSYISRFLILLSPFVYFAKKNNLKIFYYIIFFFVCSSAIIISGERRALVDLVIFLCLSAIFNYKNIKLYYVAFICVVIFLFINPIKDKFFKPIIFQFGFINSEALTMENMDKYGVQFKPSIFNNVYYAHYKTALNIWLDNKYIGVGNKGFRKNCNLKKYDNIKNDYFKLRCSTHPHNIYLEILSEFGLIGFIIFIYLCFFAIFKNLRYKIDNYFFPFWIYLIIILIPLPSGAILSTSFGSYFWGILGILLNEKTKN